MSDLKDLTIETERLILRHPREEDALEVNAATNEVWADLQQWMSWAYDGFNTREATQEFITDFCAEQIKHGGVQLFGFDKETGKFVVATGLTFKEGLRPHEFVTGYWVAKNFLGKGYATEATKGVLKYAFERHGAEVIFIDYLDNNDKSRRIIEKCGFEFIQTNPKNHARCSDGVLMDEHCYKMTKERYRELAL